MGFTASLFAGGGTAGAVATRQRVVRSKSGKLAGAQPDTEVDTFTITGLAADSLIQVFLICEDPLGLTNNQPKVRVSDGTNTQDTLPALTDTHYAWIDITQSPDTNTKARISMMEARGNWGVPTSQRGIESVTTFNADWITGTVTLSLRTSSNVAPNNPVYWKWVVTVD